MPIIYPLSWPGGVGSVPNTNQVKLRALSTVGVSISPFTGQSQVQEWPGEMWMAEGSFPAMKRPEAETLTSFLLSLRGRAGTFMFGDPAGRTPRGVATGTPYAFATNTGGLKRLITRGWTPSTTGVLLPGDYVQIFRNKLLFGDDFTNAAWTKTQCTVGTADAIVDPVSTTTAERITPDGGATDASVLQGTVFDCASKTFTFSIYLKAASGTPSIKICILNQASSFIATTTCNLTTSWQYFTVTATMGDTDTTVVSAIGGQSTFVAADGAIDAWGASMGGEVDCELKKVLTQADSNSTTGVNLDIFPRIHTTIPPFSRIVTASPRGVFRLTSNQQDWDYDRMQLYGISFSAAEVI